MRLSLVLVFLLLVGISIGVVSLFFAKNHAKSLFLAALILAFSLSGGVLIFLTLKQDVGGALKVFLILTGVAPGAVTVSVLLHNAIYALAKGLFDKEFEEPVFFSIALFACPAAFLVGVVGSIVLIIRNLVRS